MTVNLNGRIAVIAALLAAPVIVHGCSLPPDDRATRIDADDLAELANPTTTTTTTTTTVPASTLPPSTDLGATQPEPTTTTTIAEIATQRQRIYYTVGSSDDLAAVPLLLSESATYAVLRNELEVPRPEVRAQRFASAVRPGLIDGFTPDQSTATLTIALDGEIFDSLTESQRRRAIGQIVLTYTTFAPPDAGAAGFVNFTVDGSPISVVIPRTGSLSEEGERLTFADFRPLVDDASGPTDDTTPPPTETPSTSSPPDSSPPSTFA